MPPDDPPPLGALVDGAREAGGLDVGAFVEGIWTWGTRTGGFTCGTAGGVTLGGLTGVVGRGGTSTCANATAGIASTLAAPANTNMRTPALFNFESFRASPVPSACARVVGVPAER